LTFRSGWVGVASYNNFIDFLYYSYLFNPLYAKVVEYHERPAAPAKIFYTPLSFREAFFEAMNYRGFDPIILHGEKQFKLFKRRKMLLTTLISECFEELSGPIMIFAPGLRAGEQLALHQMVGEDMFDNQKKYLRSGVAFMSRIHQAGLLTGEVKTLPEFSSTVYLNQLVFLTKVCAQLKMNILSVTAVEIQSTCGATQSTSTSTTDRPTPPSWTSSTAKTATKSSK
jgi:hypothetical protein